MNLWTDTLKGRRALKALVGFLGDDEAMKQIFDKAQASVSTNREEESLFGIRNRTLDCLRVVAAIQFLRASTPLRITTGLKLKGKKYTLIDEQTKDGWCALSAGNLLVWALIEAVCRRLDDTKEGTCTG